MAKKELEDDLLTGGSLSSENGKASKKGGKSKKKSDTSSKNASKLAQVKAQIESLEASKAIEYDEKRLADIEKQLAKLNKKYTALTVDKKALKDDKRREKNEAKRAALKKQIDEVKEAKAIENDEKRKAKLDKKLDSLTAKYSAVGADSTGLAPRTSKIIKSVICIVLVVALLCAYVATGTVRKGLVATLGIPAQYFTAITVTNGDQKAKIKVATYNYYFSNLYNSLQSTQETYSEYGLDLETYNLDVDFDKKLSSQTTENDDGEEVTWAEYLKEETLESIESTYTYYLAAVEANGGEDPEITEDQQDELDETLDEYKETAESYGYTLSGYLVAAMGKGVTESVFRTEATRSYIAENYQEELEETISETEYSEEDYETYKDENEDDLVSVDIRVFECESEDEATEFYEALKSDGSNFSKLCCKYATTDFDATAYEDDGYSTIYGATKSILENRGLAIATADDDDETPGLDWLFSEDRKAGDSYQYSTTVVYVMSPVSLSDRKTVDVRHILVVPETDDDDTDVTEATDEQWAAALETAQDILDQYNDDPTEDNFATLATDNSEDTGSTDNGGLYEDVVPGQMVDSFSTWCFDPDRKAGDTEIVKSDYGYHIMYYVGEGDLTVWEYTAQQALAEEDATSATDELEEAYTLKVHWLGSRYFQKDVDIDS